MLMSDPTESAEQPNPTLLSIQIPFPHTGCSQYSRNFTKTIFLWLLTRISCESVKALLKPKFIGSAASPTATKPEPCYKRKPDLCDRISS